jgi:putative ABC transport system permease protein
MVRRSLRQHFVSTAITALCVALATGLVMSVFAINKQTKTAFTGGPVGFDAVLGARGSQLQLVLNTVFHLETSPGNVPWSLYQAISKERGVQLAVPYAVGDNHKGFRIVGTTAEMFTEFEYQKGKRFELAQGRQFDVNRQEAVIGSFVAQKTGMTVGSIFQPMHGLTESENAHTHSEEYVVVGVMEASNSPSDRVIWIPIEGIFRMGGHVLRGSGEKFEAKRGEEIPDEHKEVSAVMLKLRNPQSGMMLKQKINNQGSVATLAWPIGAVMGELFEKLGWVHRVLTMVAYLVVVVAAASILASIYNTINERRREFAILRALGARRRTVFSAIVAETTAIALIGVMFGFVVYGAILYSAAQVIRSTTGVVIDLLAWDPVLVLAPLGIVLLGAVAGIFPAVKAYRTDVAKNIVPSS